MDIASILAQAAEDTFAKDPLREDEQHYVQKQPQVLDSEDYNSDSEAHRNSKDRNGTEYQGQAVSKIDILKAAAQQVEKEEYRLTKEALSSAVEETEAELIRTKDITKKEAEALLLEASEEEQQYYEEVTGTTSIKQPEPVTVIPVDDEELHQQEQIDSGSEAESETSDEEENEEDDYDTNSSAQLIIACYRDRLDQVKQLLKNGGDPLARDRHGWTPLHWAASKGYEEVAEALIRHRIANDKSVKKMVNAVDNITGWTPLHVSILSD